MDTIAASVLDTGGFWQRGASDGVSAWQETGEEDEGEDDLQQGIGTWEGGSISLQDSELAGSEEFGYGYSSYGYGSHDEWGAHIPDPDTDTFPARRGEKRRADSLSADGFDTPQTPNSPILQGSSSKARNSGTGSLFFKTKLCIKFKAGTCPYNSSCNFAHGMDELRKPPPGWEDMVGIQDTGVVSGGSNAVPSSADSLRFRRTRRCKKYYSEEGCPYGERCNFLHDDQVKARESNAISLGPATSNSTGGGGGGGGNGNGGNERPSNWKTRMCNKWEMTGHCPFGQKCNFAHGLPELQSYAGTPIDVDARATPGNGVPSESKQTVRAAPKSVPDAGASYASTVFVSDGLNTNTALRHRSTHSSSSKSQKQTKVIANWKGPADEISTIYGDWIEEDE
eukprot:c19097_g1_i1 orf=75-1262(+)